MAEVCPQPPFVKREQSTADYSEAAIDLDQCAVANFPASARETDFYKMALGEWRRSSDGFCTFDTSISWCVESMRQELGLAFEKVRYISVA
jgi:hypothetical protein